MRQRKFKFDLKLNTIWGWLVAAMWDGTTKTQSISIMAKSSTGQCWSALVHGVQQPDGGEVGEQWFVLLPPALEASRSAWDIPVFTN